MDLSCLHFSAEAARSANSTGCTQSALQTVSTEHSKLAGAPLANQAPPLMKPIYCEFLPLRLLGNAFSLEQKEGLRSTRRQSNEENAQ